MVMKARETKRYEFEAVNAAQASEIVHKIVCSFVLITNLAYVDECME